MGLAGIMYTCSFFCLQLKSTLKPDFNVNSMSLCTSTRNGPTAMENHITFWINILQMCCWEGRRCKGVQKVCKILSIALSWWMGMWHLCTYFFPNPITVCCIFKCWTVFTLNLPFRAPLVISYITLRILKIMLRQAFATFFCVAGRSMCTYYLWEWIYNLQVDKWNEERENGTYTGRY